MIIKKKLKYLVLKYNQSFQKKFEKKSNISSLKTTQVFVDSFNETQQRFFEVFEVPELTGIKNQTPSYTPYS